MVRETGGRTIERPVFRSSPELDMTIADAESLAGVRAATRLGNAAHRLTTDYVRQAREDGHSWHEVGMALGLGDEAEHGGSLASAAYDYAADHLTVGRRSIVWTCLACNRTVIDNGPEAGHPADAEVGHADGCSRLTAAIEAWETAWEAEAD